MKQSSRLAAEVIGTFWLVFGGCGSAVLAAAFPDLGVGFTGVALAFGLTVLTGAYAFGNVSGAHFNPAITVGLATAGRFAWKDVVPYVVAQCLGAVIAAVILYFIASGTVDFTLASGFAANGYAEHSPGGYGTGACFLLEVVATFMFVMVVLGATDERAPKGFAPLAIGLALTLVHLFSIPVTNASVNPARSLGPALFAGTWALGQLWMFIVAPLLGAVAAAWCYNVVIEGRPYTRQSREQGVPLATRA